MKRILTALLAGLFVLMTFAACSDSKVNSGNDANPSQTTQGQTPGATDAEGEEETRKFLDDMPETMDFQGRTVKFIATEGSNGNITELSIRAEENSGDVVEDAVFNRNLTVCDRLNVAIELVDLFTDFSGCNEPLRTAVKSGTSDFDIAGTYQYYGIVVAAEGILFNLNNKTRFPYNDFEREYGGTQYMKSMSYDGNSYYWATGDMALRYTGGMYVTYVNSTLFTNYYNDVNLYSVVDEGEWTVDKVSEYASGVYQDLNGNGSKDSSDLYGFILQSNDLTDGFAAGCMVDFSSRDENGLPYLTLDNEHTYTFWEKYYALMFENPGTMLNPSTDDSVTSMTNFSAGQFMMTCNKLYQSAIYLREMEDNFYILPLPKLDVAQDHYNTRIHDSCTLFGVPITVSDTECISATLEALASESAKVVTPAYYEVALKVKFTRDSDSGRMIELVHENVNIDFAAQWSNKIGNINHFFRGRADAKDTAIASSIAKNKKVWDKSMEKLFSQLEKASEND